MYIFNSTSGAAKEIQTMHDQRKVQMRHSDNLLTLMVTPRQRKFIERVTATQNMSISLETRPRDQPT